MNAFSALREFFVQTRNFACDTFGNAQIPVIARFSLLEPDTIFGGNKYVHFDLEWLTTDRERMIATEEQIEVEREQVSDVNETGSMRGLQSAAQTASQAFDEDSMDLGPDSNWIL